MNYLKKNLKLYLLKKNTQIKKMNIIFKKREVKLYHQKIELDALKDSRKKL